MDATAMLREFCDAVERRDGRRFADLFCEDGVYHDVFYGEFAGQKKIAEMINDWFFKSATDMRWDMHDPVCDGKILYARYIFSYTSLLPEASGRRAMFEGVARVVKRTGDGSIIEFRSVVDAVRCAIEVQNGMVERNAGLPPERRIEFRVSIHPRRCSRGERRRPDGRCR